jgi:hypothetical protein
VKNNSLKIKKLSKNSCLKLDKFVEKQIINKMCKINKLRDMKTNKNKKLT